MSNLPILLTPAAVDYFKQYLAKKPSGSGILFSVDKKGCSGLKYQTETVLHPKDEQFESYEYEGLSLYIDRDSIVFFRGMEVDAEQQSLGQQKIIYRNPHATHVCGCGESFSYIENPDGQA